MKSINSINVDILILLENSTKIGWNSLKNNSIHRILYLCSILFSFKYDSIKNPFDTEYDFSIDLTGPFCNNIDNSLIFLETNDFISFKNNSYTINIHNLPNNLNELPNYKLKSDWITTILYILSSYGESKIYDFVFEDPEYQYKLLSNTSNILNLKSDSETIINLNIFKNEFEKSLSNEIDINKIDNQKYLTLYFDYIFSKILKGEDIHD